MGWFEIVLKLQYCNIEALNTAWKNDQTLYLLFKEKKTVIDRKTKIWTWHTYSAQTAHYTLYSKWKIERLDDLAFDVTRTQILNSAIGFHHFLQELKIKVKNSFSGSIN